MPGGYGGEFANVSMNDPGLPMLHAVIAEGLQHVIVDNSGPSDDGEVVLDRQSASPGL